MKEFPQYQYSCSYSGFDINKDGTVLKCWNLRSRLPENIIILFYWIAPSLGILLYFKLKPKCASVTDFAVYAEFSLVQYKYVLDDGKTETASVSGTDMVGAGFIVSVPNMLQLFRLYAHPVISNLKSELAAFFDSADIYGAVDAAVFNSIVQKIIDDLLDLDLVRIDFDIFRAVEDYRVALLLDKNTV